MQDLSVIKNEKLRDAIKKSLHFAALSEKDQLEQIEKINKLPPEQQQKFQDFFTKENEKEAKEQSEKLQNQQSLLGQFSQDLEDLKKKFTILAREDQEAMERSREVKHGDNLLQQLNNL